MFKENSEQRSQDSPLEQVKRVIFLTFLNLNDIG